MLLTNSIGSDNADYYPYLIKHMNWNNKIEAWGLAFLWSKGSRWLQMKQETEVFHYSLQQTKEKLQTLELSPLLCSLFRLVNSHSSSLFSLSWPQTFTKFSGSRIHFSFPVEQVTLFTVSCAWDLQVLLENTLKKMGEYIVIHNKGPRHKRSLSSYWKTQYIFNWDISQQQGQLFKTPVSQ